MILDLVEEEITGNKKCQLVSMKVLELDIRRGENEEEKIRISSSITI